MRRLPTCDGSAPGIRRPGLRPSSVTVYFMITALGLHVTTHGMFRMDVPSSEFLERHKG